MSKPAQSHGLEPLDALDVKALPTTPHLIRTGLRINIRGRSGRLWTEEQLCGAIAYVEYEQGEPLE